MEISYVKKYDSVDYEKEVWNNFMILNNKEE